MTSRRRTAWSFDRTIELGLVREFQADSPVVNPANGALDRTVLAQMELEQIVDIGLEAGADHRTTARDVDELHLVFGARVSHARLLPDEAVPIALATIAARSLLRPQRRSAGFLRDTVDSRSDIHQRSHLAPAARP